MCDYSLSAIASRPAAVGDKLTTKSFGTGTRGFAASEDANVAVCLLPGTELSFSKEISVYAVEKPHPHMTAIFRQIHKDRPDMHHDAIEMPDGKMALLTFLSEGQQATVLQLPAKPRTQKEAEEQTRVVFAG